MQPTKENGSEQANRLDLPQHDLLVMGSGRLIHALREHDLVDECEIWIHPILVGEGKRLFEESATTTALALRRTKTTDKGITVLTFEVPH